MVLISRRKGRSEGSLPLLLLVLLLIVHNLGQVLGSAVVTTSATLTTTFPDHIDLAYDIDQRLLENRACEDLSDCRSCFRTPGCGFCGGTGQCMPEAHASTCGKGWSNAGVCYTTCPVESVPFHDAAGVIQLGAQAPRPVKYIPGDACTYTIWPLLDTGTTGGNGPTGGNRRTLMIRLQFEYMDLGPGDSLSIFSNGLDGPKILSIGGNGEGVVNRIITSRSSSVVLRLNANGHEGGTGFRVYWRVIENSPLDIYLISAIIVTSILTCILCSCCCNNCVAMMVGQHHDDGVGGGGMGRFGLSFGVGARAAGAAGATGRGMARALSAQEKARLPIAPYDPGPGAGGEEGKEGGKEGGLENGPSSIFQCDMRECCICLSDFERTDLVRKLPCGHLFHSECVDSWFSFNSVCPLCKANVLDKLNQYPLPEGVDGGSGGGMGPRALIDLLRQRMLVHVRRNPPRARTYPAAAAAAPAAPVLAAGGGVGGEREEEGREDGLGGGGWLRWWGSRRYAPSSTAGGGGGGEGEEREGEQEEEELEEETEEEEHVMVFQLSPERRGGGGGEGEGGGGGGGGDGGGGDVELGEMEGEMEEGQERRNENVMAMAQ
ncbi:ring finger protein [Nannochloropsis oceanica]